MRELIIQYWLETLLGTLTAIMGFWVKKLKDKLKEKKEKEKAELKAKEVEYEALVEGVKAILHDMLFQICEEYIELGYIPFNVVEKVKNREKMIYKTYNEGLHGNSTGTDVHNAFNALPIKAIEEEEDE